MNYFLKKLKIKKNNKKEIKPGAVRPNKQRPMSYPIKQRLARGPLFFKKL
jgi:hypothetical protein